MYLQERKIAAEKIGTESAVAGRTVVEIFKYCQKLSLLSLMMGNISFTNVTRCSISKILWAPGSPLKSHQEICRPVGTLTSICNKVLIKQRKVVEL